MTCVPIWFLPYRLRLAPPKIDPTLLKNRVFNNFCLTDTTGDLQGSHWAPHLIHKSLWDEVGGFSEEYFPGTGSDPDLNMKLWKKGIRIFKGINDFKVYHFGSIVTRKYKNHPTIVTESGSRGGKIFLLKWGISINFFKKFFLNSDTVYINELRDPKISFKFLIRYLLCKLNYFYVKYIYNFNNRNNLN